MAPYEIVESTADAGIRITAHRLEEFFTDAARGMFNIICDEEVEGWPSSHEISLDASDAEGLLVDWLSELLYLFDVKKFIFKDADFRQLDSTMLRCTARGASFRGQLIGTEIKAVTHHMLEILHTDEGYEATVYFDL